MMLIGEVAQRAGLATSAIRFYEERGLLPEPKRTASGYRRYDPEVIARLQFIRAGQAVGLSLDEVARVLDIRDRGESPCHHVTELIDDRISEVDQRIEDLHRLRHGLVALQRRASDLAPEDCPPENICHLLIG